MKVSETVLDWLLGSDPAIRWQTMRDLTGSSDEQVNEARSLVSRQGWGAAILDQQAPNGGWSHVEEPTRFHETPEGSTLQALDLLVDLGVDPTDERVHQAVTLVRDEVRHPWADRPYFEGETEACINGRVLRAGAYFGEPSEVLLEQLLSEQLEDGGWNCDAPESTRSSFNSTIVVLEGLLEFAMQEGSSDSLSAAAARGQEYLLERKMFRSRTTGDVINEEWQLFSFPTNWHYDVLWGLDYLRNAGVEADDRVDEALNVVKSHRGDDGRWALARKHQDLAVDVGEKDGEPSLWNTLRALRVLQWAGR